MKNKPDSVKTIGILALTTIFSFFMAHITNYYNSYNHSFTAYFLAVILISLVTKGYVWGIIASIASVVGVNYYFTEPYYRFDFSVRSFIIIIQILIISIITSCITSYNKQKAEEAFEVLEKTNRLNEINNKLVSANNLSYIGELAVDYVYKLTDSTVVFYFHSPQLEDGGIIKSKNKEQEILIRSYHEQFIANWVFEHKKSAGVGTDFCGNSSYIYLPLISHDKVWGVIGIYRNQVNASRIKENTITFISLIVSQVAMALERQFLTDTRHRIMVETEKEKMRANLLRAVSHDLRTPLTGIIGISETLSQMIDSIPKEEQVTLLNHIHEDSNWLLNMVENLLSVTRIREDNSSVRKVPQPLEEVVSESMLRIKKRLADIHITVKIPEEYIMIPMDATLIEQVIINLVENAYKHSGSQTPIELIVTKEDSFVFFKVIDHGRGLAETRIDFIFENSDSLKGAGIGLSICKTIILAHGGTITARNGLDDGAVFTFCLPLEGD